MRISFTRFSTYDTCPQRYKLQYVDRIPVPTAPELHFGSAVHEALRFLYDPKNLERPSLEMAVSAFIAAWRAREQDVAEERRQAYFEQGVDIIRRHYEKRFPPKDGRTVAATERQFDIALGREHTLNGRIDRIDVLPDQRVEIIDYKTGRTMPTQPMAEKDRQLAIYRMAADELYPGYKVTTIFLYLRHDFELKVDHGEEFLEETRAAVAEAVARIEVGDFDPNPGAHCDWCPYREHCPLFRAPVVPEDLEKVDIGALLREYADLKSQEKTISIRLGELKDQINAYLDACGTAQVEGNGYVAQRRAYKRIAAWDKARLKQTLEPLGLWDSVTDATSKSLKDLLSSDRLSFEQKREVEAALTWGETRTLRIKPAAGLRQEEENDA